MVMFTRQDVSVPAICRCVASRTHPTICCLAPVVPRSSVLAACVALPPASRRYEPWTWRCVIDKMYLAPPSIGALLRERTRRFAASRPLCCVPRFWDPALLCRLHPCGM